MQHQASRIQAQDVLAFFADYLGPTVLEELNETAASPLGWRAETSHLLRDLVTMFADLMPHADHVVRRDVGRNFTMYVGYKSPGGNQRGHYVDIAANGDRFTLRISGSPDPRRREQLAQAHAATRNLHGFVVSNAEQLAKARPLVEAVASIYNPEIESKKQSVCGWTPATCRETEESERTEQQALAEVVAYLRARRANYTDEQWQRLRTRRDTVLVPAVKQGSSVERAVELAFAS